MQSKRSKLLGAALGLSLIFAGSSSAFAQEDAAMGEGADEAIASETMEVSTSTNSFSTAAAGAFGQPGDRSGTTGMGHATDSSNNWLGDVAEGLSNQYMSDDSNNPDTGHVEAQSDTGHGNGQSGANLP